MRGWRKRECMGSQVRFRSIVMRQVHRQQHVSWLGTIYSVSLAPVRILRSQHTTKSLSINISIDFLQYQLLLLHCNIEVLFLNYFLSGEQGILATLHDDNQEPYPRPRMQLCSCKSSKPPPGDGFYSRSVVDEGVIT